MKLMLSLPFLNQKSSADVQINLIPEDPFFKTVLGRTLRWALSVGRYIVIFTELLVILSFVARFTLDRQLTDLNESIHEKKTVIESYGTLENNVRLTQAKIKQYEQLEQQTNLSEVFPALSQIIPNGVKLAELVINPKRVILNGRTSSQDSLNTLINNLQLSSDFVQISVDKIEASGQNEPGFEFSMRAQTNLSKNSAGAE
jgi:Tfp pilus assembly protein PilN